MYHILYVSTAAVTMSDEELDQLLKQSHLNNSKNNITGMLLYCNNNFIQVLEGKEADVKKTFQRIEQDCRHYDIIKLADGPVHDKSFSQWAMGFQYTSDQEIAAKLGYTKPSQLFTPEILCEIEEGTVISVLKEFADHSGDKI